ncbi:MAG: type II toxin-antitoxin system VapC family toxin [Chloroflexi bacterium]|nr:type II toxin-antitoxin system VapC family toxin [Chloroflexota bacterium]
MRYMLDTNICIYIIRRKPIDVRAKFEQYSITDFALSTITLAELEYGVEKSSAKATNRHALDLFLIPLTILDFDEAAGKQYGGIRTALEMTGLPIGAMDLLIAAHALSLQLTLVTNNAREFRRVPGLMVEEWFSP